MKRIITIILAFVSINAFSQKVSIDNFYLSTTGQTYEIYANIDCESSPLVFMDMDADGAGEFARMTLNPGALLDFAKQLTKAKEKYIRWTEVAKKNYISLLSKDMSAKFFDQDVYFTDGGTWHKAEGTLYARFLVDANGNCYMYLCVGDLEKTEVVARSSSFSYSFNPSAGRFSSNSSTSTSSMVYHSSGAQLIFSSPEEIDTLINCLTKVSKWKLQNRDCSQYFK